MVAAFVIGLVAVVVNWLLVHGIARTLVSTGKARRESYSLAF